MREGQLLMSPEGGSKKSVTKTTPIDEGEAPRTTVSWGVGIQEFLVWGPTEGENSGYTELRNEEVSDGGERGRTS